MPRRKVSMGLIPNRRVRVATFAKRKEGLKKKARELSTLCGVRIALVCCPAADDSAGAAAAAGADVWESAAGVLDAYREVPPEERVKHTHLVYAERELGKAEAKLVKVQQEGPAALAPEHAAVFEFTLEKAQRVLETVDEALRATNERRRALGLPVDDGSADGGCWLTGIFAAPGASDAVVPLGFAAPSFVGCNFVNMDGGMLRAQGNGNEKVMWDSGFHPCGAATMHPGPGNGFQQCADMDGSYQLQMAADMYGNNSNTIGWLSWDTFQPRSGFAVQPGFDFQCMGSSYVGLSGYGTQQVTGTGSTQSNLTMLSTDEPRNAIVPVGYPTLDIDLNYFDAPAVQAAKGIHGRSYAGSNFNAAPALSLTMGTGDNFVNVPQDEALVVNCSGDLGNAGDYGSQWSAGQL